MTGKEKGLKAALIAIGIALVAVIAVLVLVLTGVFGKKDKADTDTARSGRTKSVRQREDETDDDASMPELYDAETDRVAKDLFLENNGGNVVVMRMAYETLTIPDAPRNVRRVIDEMNEERAQTMRDHVLDYAQTLHDAYYGGAGNWPWQMYQWVNVDRADSDVISFRVTDYGYYGGTHGNTVYYGYTLDAQSGRTYELTDIVKDYDDLARAIEEEMGRSSNETFQDVLAFHREENGSFAAYFTGYFLNDVYTSFVPWTLTEEGLRIWFNDYMLGAYAYGALDIVVPYERHPELFKTAELFENADTRHPAQDRVTMRGGVDGVLVALRNYCWEEGGFLPMDYSDVAGTYVSNDGETIEIDAYGYFNDYTGIGRGEPSDIYGILRSNPGGCNMYYYPNDVDPYELPEKQFYGTLSFISQDAIEVDALFGRRTYYRQDGGMGGNAPDIGMIAMEHGLGTGSPTALKDGEQEGYWEDPVLGNSVWIYEYRGEFEAANYASGDSWTGDIVYNGNYDEPRYTLRTYDGYNLADLYYYYYNLDGTQVPVMCITLHYATGDYTTKYIKW